MIHLSDPMQEDPDQSLRKVSSFLNLLAESYKRVYVQKQNDSADEYRSVSKGRLKFRVCVYIYIYIYIPSKRERYGIKIYMIPESDTGYLVFFIDYCGSDPKHPPPEKELPKKFDDFSNPSKVVLSYHHLVWIKVIESL